MSMRNKVVLKNDSHIFQMLGNFDERHGYALPKEIADILIKMPKKPVVSDDEVDVGINVAFLQSEDGTKFCLEGSILYLVEHATEMGGIVAYTYLSPLAEITDEYFKNLDAGLDLTPIKERAQKRRAQYTSMLAEHERLARSACRRVQKTLDTHPLPEYSELLKTGKPFVRLGKPDYNTSQLQMLTYVIDKNDLTHPAVEIINRWKTTCNNKTSAALISEPLTEFHMPELIHKKKDGSDGKKGKKLDFKHLITALLKQDATAKPPVRLKPCENAAKILNAETEVEHDFEPEELPETPGEKDKPEHALDNEEMKLQQLVTALLRNYQPSPTVAKPQTKSKTARQGMTKDHLLQHAPVSSNRDREQ